MVIYIFGNPTLKKDALPIKLLPKLQNKFPEITFLHTDPTEVWNQENKNVVILDTVEGIKNITIFNGLNDFQNITGKLTVHDYDLYQDLAMQLKIRKIVSITIIGLPIQDQTQDLYNQICKAIQSLN